MDPVESEIINDPVIRVQFDAALASDTPLVARPEIHTPETWQVRARYVAQSPEAVSGPQFDRWLAVNNGELALLRALEEAVREAWHTYDRGYSAKRAILMVGKALGWA